jgi:predicted DNA-binding transcriptional regulator YafY
MSEGLPIARSTFNRHRDAILDMFGVIIECDKKDGFRYYIYNEEVLEEDTIQNWMLSTLSVNSILSESKGVYDRILLEQVPSDGDNLHKFIDAMKRGVRVKVGYRKYGSAESKSTMTLEPYFVKLFKRRWYALVKFPEPNGQLFTLAFDRIVSFEVTEDKYAYDKDFDPAGWFRNCYGIVKDPDVPVEKVVIRAFGYEANYLRDLPFHPSQKEIAIEEGYSDFELTLSPTADFWTPLLSRGSAIKILQPQWLADEIKRQHLEAAKLYE